MRILFAASPAIAVPVLEVLSKMELEGKGVALAGILTNPDSRQGRRGQEEPTAVSAAASELDVMRKEKDFPSIPQLKPEKLDARSRAEAAAVKADLLVSFAYGRIFGPRFMALFPFGGINIHPSLLPQYRGASPVPAVIRAREKETGICIQRLTAEMDTGDILAEDRFPLSGRETTSSLSETVSRRAALLLAELLGDFSGHLSRARPQEGAASYCGQIKKEDGLINWNRSAAEIDGQIRAFTPWPLSFTRCGETTLFILEGRPVPAVVPSASPSAFPPVSPGTVLGMDKEHGILIQTADGILAVSRLQWQAKKALDWKAFINGARDFMGVTLS